MQGMTLTPGSNINRCPFFNGSMNKTAAKQPAADAFQGFGAPAEISDSVTITPFEAADGSSLSKTCVSAGAQATMGMLPGVAKAGCPHAA